MRKCPFHNCDHYIRTSFFCCAHHFSILDSAERERLHSAALSYYDRRLTLEGLRAVQQEVLGLRGLAWVDEEPGKAVKGGNNASTV